MKRITKDPQNLNIVIDYIDGEYGVVKVGTNGVLEFGTGEFTDPIYAVFVAAFTAGKIYGAEAAFEVLNAFHEREQLEGRPNLNSKLIKD